MEKLRESDILTTRFWTDLLERAPKTQGAVQLTYRHAFLVMFLYTDAGRSSTDSIASKIWLSDNPGGSNSISDERLRTQSVYDWLMSGTDQGYYERVERAYFATLETFGRQRRENLQFSMHREWLPKQAEFLRNWLDDTNLRQILNAFDQGHSALIKSSIDIARESFASNLAASFLFSRKSKIADFFGPTGQFARLVANQTRQNISCLLGRHDSYDELIDMRMQMQHIRYEYIENYEPNDGNYVDWPFPVDFLLINPTPPGGGGTVSRPSDIQAPGGSPSAIELIGKLCDARTYFKFALVVVPNIDCHSKQWPSTIRRKLVESGRVAAVVDFPRTASDSKRRFSAWLIAGDKAKMGQKTYREILFVDAEPLSLLTPTNDYEPATQFIAALIADIFDDVDSQFSLINQLEITEPLLARIFAREFSPGSHEAPGLSRSVHIDEVRAHGFALSAKTYLRSNEDAAWLHGTDKRPLDALLKQKSRLGKRIYIIGNNGEGKSFLLRDIASSSAKDGRNTVAIASGTTDRFPKSMSGVGDVYRYKGARTSATGVNGLKTAVDVGRLMLEIYSKPERLSVFEQIVDVIGFTSQQFLIPKELNENSKSEHSFVSGIVRLASRDSHDMELKKKFREFPDLVKKYKLGLRRVSDDDGIVPFNELSSGEQQIILLAAKMVSEAERNVLFVVDEPEISLHVGWQRALPKVFSIIATQFGADILVATHSPVVIASADERDDYCFTIRDRALLRLSHDDRRSVETALFEGFRTHTNNNREVHERCASLVADFIEIANQENAEDGSKESVLSKLKDMRMIVTEQNRFVGQDSIEFEIELIDRAQAAIQEIAILSTNNAVQRGDE